MYIKVKAYPGSKEEVVKRVGEDTFIMYIREVALRGQANKRILTILQSEYPGVRIRLVSGHVKHNKVFEIKN